MSRTAATKLPESSPGQAPGRNGPERIGISSTARRGPDRTLRILLVDDAPVNLAAFCRILGRMGCSVDPVSTGEYAVTMFEEGCVDSRYDLIMIDLNMPGFDGLETTRPDPRHRGPVTRGPSLPGAPRAHPGLDHQNPGDRLEACRKAGMNDYMYKPFDCDVLKEALARWVPVPA